MVTVAILLNAVASLYAQQWHTTIDITYPAEINMPLSVSDVLLVNNAVAHPENPQGVFYTLMAASEVMEGSDYLPAVLEISQNTSGSLYRKQLLTDIQVDSLLTLYQSDALLVLNQQIVHPTTESYPTEAETFYAYVEVIAASHWSLYYRQPADENGLMQIGSRTLHYADTLYWESEADNISEAMAALPSLEDARNEMCFYIGEHLAERFLPHVETVDRYLYDLGKNDPGMNYFTRKQWEQAIEAWSEPQRDTKHSAYAAANSALAYEILGDLNAAYSTASQAVELFSSLRSAEARQQAVNVNYYCESLRARMQR